MKALLFRKLSLLILCMVFPLLTQTVLAQNSKNDWAQVRNIKTGSKLTIKTKSGQKFNGKALVVTADSITISIRKPSGKDVELKREEISEIRKKSAALTAGYAALLGGLGFVGGYGIGYGVGEATDARFAIEYPIAVFGAAAGAIVGAIIGSKGQVIYKSP